MKKFVIAIGFIALFAGPVGSAPLLRLDKPNGGEVLVSASDYYISWTAREITQNVKLLLLQNNVLVGVIRTDLAPGSSPFKWKVGKYSAGNAPAGSGFAIRIKTMDGTLLDVSDGTFTITASSSGDKPDFQVSHMVCSPRLKNGAVQKVVVQLYVKNNGADYQGPLSVHYICLDSLVHSQIALDEVITTPAANIPHGQWYGFTLCEPAWPAGVKTIHFGIQIDPANLVHETDETNNHFDYSYTLPPLDEIPDL